MRGTRWRPGVVILNLPVTAQASVEDALQVVLTTDAQLGAVNGHASAYPARVLAPPAVFGPWALERTTAPVDAGARERSNPAVPEPGRV